MVCTQAARIAIVSALTLATGRASAAQFNFFFTSANDSSVSTPSQALSAKTNPTVRVGDSAEISLWVAVDPAFVADHQGLTGAWLDVGECGGQTFGSELVVYNPHDRWGLQSEPGIPGGAGYTHVGLQFGTLSGFPGPLGAPPEEIWNGLWVYRIASGEFRANAPGGLFIEIPFLGGIGYSDYASWDPSNPDPQLFTGGTSFGFADGRFDTDAIARNYYDPNVVMSVPFRHGNPAEGFLGDGVFLDGAVRTTTPDIFVVAAPNPEPATLGLLGLGIAMTAIRRR